MNSSSQVLWEHETAAVAGIGACDDTESIRRRCLNPDCIGGYSARSTGGLRVCPACDGYGYIAGTAENRRRYNALRSVAVELEVQSRTKRGLIDDRALAAMLGESGGDSSIPDEPSAVVMASAGSCRRVS